MQMCKGKSGPHDKDVVGRRTNGQCAECSREAIQRYSVSENGREVERRRRGSESWREWSRQYEATARRREMHREMNRRYRSTEKGRAAWRRYLGTPEVAMRIATKSWLRRLRNGMAGKEQLIAQLEAELG